MNKPTKNILLLFIALSIVKSLFALFTHAPSTFSDDYIYMRMAWGIFHQGSFLVNGVLPTFPPLYSLLLALSYSPSNMAVAYAIMKILNAMLSSLSVIPLYLIAKDFLNERDSFMAVLMAALLGPHFLYPSYILAENLFFPLFTISLYCLYRAFTGNSLKFSVISGIMLGLVIATKTIGYALLPLAFLGFLLLRRRLGITRLISHYSSAFLVILPFYLMRQAASASDTFMGYPKSITSAGLINNLTSNIITFLNWHINYIGYLFLGIGVFFGIYFIAGLFSKKEERLKAIYTLSALGTFLLVFISASFSSSGALQHNSPFIFYTYRAMGRYVEAALPLILLLGFIAYRKNIANIRAIKIAAIASSLVMLVSTQLTLSSLFPPNNISLTFLGAFKAALNYAFYSNPVDIAFHWGSFMIVAVILASLPLILLAIRKTRFMVPLMIIFIAGNTLLAYGVHIWNVENYWANNDQASMGRWINENIDSGKTIMIDTANCLLKSKEDLNSYICSDTIPKSSYLGVFITTPLEYGESSSGKADYFVSLNKAENYTLVKEFGTIRLYAH